MKVEEAKEKWCCNREVDKCIASECMAWRWNYNVDGIENKAVAETIVGELIYDDVRVKLPSTTEGYCGLAGKEGRSDE